jgi:hypothetical protein
VPGGRERIFVGRVLAPARAAGSRTTVNARQANADRPHLEVRTETCPMRIPPFEPVTARRKPTRPAVSRLRSHPVDRDGGRARAECKQSANSPHATGRHSRGSGKHRNRRFAACFRTARHCLTLPQWLPKPKVAGSRPVVRSHTVAERRRFSLQNQRFTDGRSAPPYARTCGDVRPLLDSWSHFGRIPANCRPLHYE